MLAYGQKHLTFHFSCSVLFHSLPFSFPRLLMATSNRTVLSADESPSVLGGPLSCLMILFWCAFFSAFRVSLGTSSTETISMK